MASAGSAWQALLGRLRFGLIDLVRGTHTVALLRQLEVAQFAPAAHLALQQKSALADYVNRVRASSMLYATYGAFVQFPVIDKAFANARRSKLINRNYRGKLVRKKTGGSTGEPFVYVTGTRAQSWLWAAILLSWRVAGYQLGEPVAFLAGSALFGSGYRQRWYYRLMNVTLLSAFDLSQARLGQYVQRLCSQRCRLLYGYASAIHLLAQYLLTLPARPPLALRAVVCTAEVLTDSMRADIERAFQVDCYSQYGCNDAGVAAYECEQRAGFHLITGRAWHEVLPDGRLIATDMANDAMFLPRYDTGDLVSMAPQACPCGRGFPLIQTVIGRANDVVCDPAGNAVHAEFFTHLFREDALIAAFQVLYDTVELVIIIRCPKTVPLLDNYVGRIGASLQFDMIRIVANVPFICIKNGKHRFVLKLDSVASELAHAHG